MTCCENYHVVSHQLSIGQRVRGFFSKGIQATKLFAKNEIAGFKTRRKQRTDRQAFNQLMNLEDYILDDIGVERGDVDWARKLPLSANASAKLDSIRLQTRIARLARARPKRRH